MNKFGTLYIVGTPIGNLEDVTLRAVKILCDVDIILAEDTRVTSKLIGFIRSLGNDLKGKLISYHQHSGETKKTEILKYLLEGENLALVTDAGTPGISDPGGELIEFLLESEPKIKTVPVPGASSLVTALSVSGIRANKFVFLGFLPKKGRTKLFSWIKAGKFTFCFFESPRRIVKTIKIIKEEFDDPRIFVARELTKMHETVYRGRALEIINQLGENPKGEIVVVVESI